MEMRAITQSEMVTRAKCEQLHKFKYIERLRPRLISLNLGVGSAVHCGLELKDPIAAAKHLRDHAENTLSKEEADSIELWSGIVEAMVQGALRFWTEWPKASEVEFSLALRNPETGRQSRIHTYAGKMDGLSDDEVHEYKTSSRLDSNYIDRLDVDFQVSAMLEAASIILKKPIRRVRYRILRKPSIKQRKDETLSEYLERLNKDYESRPEFYFHEEVITRTESQMKLWRREAWEIHKRISRVESGGLAVRNTESCVGRFGRCSFLDLCCGAVTRDAYRVIDDPHPELGAN